MLTEARKCRSGYPDWFEKVLKVPLEFGRLSSSKAHDMNEYTGKYHLEGYREFSVDIGFEYEGDEKLILDVGIQGGQIHTLSHYHFDVWEFAPQSYDDYPREGYGHNQSRVEFLISFQRRSGGKVFALKWNLEESDVLFAKTEYIPEFWKPLF